MTSEPTAPQTRDSTHNDPRVLNSISRNTNVNGAERVRRGFLSRDERDWLAALLDTVEDCLIAGEAVPAPIAEVFAGVQDALRRRT